MADSKSYGKGRKQGRSEGFIGSVLHDTLNCVTGNMFGSKAQRDFNRGFRDGKRDRREGRGPKRIR